MHAVINPKLCNVLNPNRLIHVVFSNSIKTMFDHVFLDLSMVIKPNFAVTVDSTKSVLPWLKETFLNQPCPQELL